VNRNDRNYDNRLDHGNQPPHADQARLDDMLNDQLGLMDVDVVEASNEEQPERDQPTKEQSFEENLAELEQIVRRLESGEATLAEGMALFRRGTVLSTACNKYLNEAETTINQLVEQADGSFRETPFVSSDKND